jgi:pyruvate dehydrogenase E1 component
MEGRISEEQLLNFRQEVDGKGISSYPHPKLMPEFWQFPTVSMGLGPLMAIYQARFLKYLHRARHRQHREPQGLGLLRRRRDGRAESLGRDRPGAREKLDNLIFVVNCNLQRLDGPVRGNGKIIQELEGEFRGAGWNVIKLIWGSYWDPLLARDKDGLLRKVMMDTVDGDYQAMKANDGAFVRKHFFGQHPKLLEMVSKMSDDDIWRLNRGWPSTPQKVFAAYHRALITRVSRRAADQGPSRVSGMGKSGEARNTAHQTKKLTDETSRASATRFSIPVNDQQIADGIPFYKAATTRRRCVPARTPPKALGGYCRSGEPRRTNN